MTERDKPQFKTMLQGLAAALSVTFPEAASETYWDALKGFPIEKMLETCRSLARQYKPRRKDDFPVIATFLETGDQVKYRPDEMVSRTYEQIKADYRRRGILIGEEARDRLEAEMAARKQEADESWQAVSHRIIGEEPF